MQKVEGSSPFSRFTKAPQIARFLYAFSPRSGECGEWVAAYVSGE